MNEELYKLTEYSKGGGCGCKIAPSVLQQMLHTDNKGSFDKLLVGNDSNDDAAVYQLDNGTAVISTTDFFMPIVDDPYDFGRVAAANSISDIYAMGGTPIMAIAVLGWPINKLPPEVAKKVLEGGRSICAEVNIPLAGGHTIDSTDPIFGLAVTGIVSLDRLKKNNTAKAGDLLFLTKRIGVGMMATAMKRKKLKQEDYPVLIKQLTTVNKLGQELSTIPGVHAMTDVTGFGLLGHLVELAEGSGYSAELNYSAVQKMNNIDYYLQEKTIPDATARNWSSYSNKVQFEKGVNVMEAFNLLPDPQTNGGLLIAVSEGEVDKITDLFTQNGLQDFLQPIGKVVEKQEKVVYVK